MIASRAKLGIVVAVAFASVAASQQPDGSGNSAEQILASHSAEVQAAFQREGLIMLEGISPEGHVRALVRFEQPRRRVIRLLSQTARQTEYRPELKKVENHRWDETGSLDTHHMRIMFMSIDYRLRTQFAWEQHKIWWELDPEFDNGLDAVEGFWELYELDPQNTLGRFGTRVSVGEELPGWLQDSVTRKNLPEAMSNVKSWVDSNGTFRP